MMVLVWINAQLEPIVQQPGLLVFLVFVNYAHRIPVLHVMNLPKNALIINVFNVFKIVIVVHKNAIRLISVFNAYQVILHVHQLKPVVLISNVQLLV